MFAFRVNSLASQHIMDRKDFLKAMGLSAASIAVVNCIGCAKGKTDEPASIAPTNVDFSIDLSTNAYSSLKTNGAYIYKDGIIVARTTNGDYLAVSQYCPHQNYTVVYFGNLKQFYCQNHGASFSEAGVSAGKETNSPLKKYNTQLNGNILRIYS